jgi:hypothetical protein
VIENTISRKQMLYYERVVGSDNGRQGNRETEVKGSESNERFTM